MMLFQTGADTRVSTWVPLTQAVGLGLGAPNFHPQPRKGEIPAPRAQSTRAESPSMNVMCGIEKDYSAPSGLAYRLGSR